MYNITQVTLANETGGAPGGEIGPPGLSMDALIACVILSIFSVVGSVGNALAFFIYYRKREKGTSTIFILSLAVTDFLTCLIVIPYTVVTELLVYNIVYDIVCKTWMYIQTFNVPLSAFIMVAISIDRYFCICHPFLHAVTVPRAKVCVVVMIFMAALTGIVPALSHGVYYTEVKLVEINTTLDQLSVASSSATDGLAATPVTSTTPSTTPAIFTNGLFLEPAAEFINDLVGHGATINYKTQSATLSSSTSSPAAASPVMALNMTSSAVQNMTLEKVNKTVVTYGGVCVTNYLFFNPTFVTTYQRAYAAVYLFEFIIIAFLYALIYRSIMVRRAWKAKRKRMSCYASTNCAETVAEETQLTNINGTATETVLVKKNPGRFSTAMRDRTLYANIKTAAMLFVVTVGFVISFLPSWLMGLRLVPFNLIVFYMFYMNNVINPIIYAFMNRTFREDLFQMLKSCWWR